MVYWRRKDFVFARDYATLNSNSIRKRSMDDQIKGVGKDDEVDRGTRQSGHAI